MSGRLADKVSVITGAGQGIGRAAALAFVSAGSTVWAVDRNSETLAVLQSKQPAIKIKTLDVTDGQGIARLADEIGPVDVLFNCAGYVHAGGILDCTEADWDQAMNVNARSMFLMTKAFLPGMVDNGAGSIINMSSVVSSVMGIPGRFAYGTSKAAVVGLTKSIAADYVDKGIRCNAIAPGTVDSPSLGDRLAVFDDPVAARAEFVARQPMGRLGLPEEIAALAVYLASDEAAYTTGSVHVVDGGMSL
ncbi:MAG: SDR family oxidoreductase [Actinomycetota bacterium]|nr:SDR family oxidoreductase [Actinomycetota bacterium]